MAVPDEYRRSTPHLDADHPRLREFAEAAAHGARSSREQAVALYYAVRDAIHYDPYTCSLDPDTLRASSVLAAGRGYCVGKAVLLAACGRAVGLATRLGFADVRNHLATPKLLRLMGTDVFHYHGFTEFLLEDRWVKATPAFNLQLCRRFGVKPMEWDGTADAVFHEFDQAGARHMEYLACHEPAADVPIERLFSAYRRHYPLLMRAGGVPGAAEDPAWCGPDQGKPGSV